MTNIPMFTGIVEDIGKINHIYKGVKENTYTIAANKIDINTLNIGESIAVNGVCLTVVSFDEISFKVDASHETLNRTNLSNLELNSRVNLERALKMGSRLGGHIVNGHVDGVAEVLEIEPVGESIEFWFKTTDELRRYLVEKGSVAIDGISLTINKVSGSRFSVNIIPHTQAETTINQLEVGSKVNIECDILGKYTEKLLKVNSN